MNLHQLRDIPLSGDRNVLEGVPSPFKFSEELDPTEIRSVQVGLTTDPNAIQEHRPRLRASTVVQHCRDAAPTNGDELHTMAGMLLDGDSEGEVLGFQGLFLAMTGLRISESIRLRWDATGRQPGALESDKWLWIHRAKSGVNAFVVLRPELIDLLTAMRTWNVCRSPWFFPSPRSAAVPVETTSFADALKGRVIPVLGLTRRTPHGLRAFYVTVRRAQGASDPQISAEFGDKTPLPTERSRRAGAAARNCHSYRRMDPPHGHREFPPKRSFL